MLPFDDRHHRKDHVGWKLTPIDVISGHVGWRPTPIDVDQDYVGWKLI